MVLANRIFVVPALFLCANAGIFDQDLRNIGSNSIQRFEQVSAMRVAEVREIVQELGQMSERRLADIESLVSKANVAEVLRDIENMTGRVDNMVGGNIARMEKAVERVMKSVMMVPFLIFAYLMLYRYAGRLGPWKTTALGVVVALGVDLYLLHA
ncbi:hypothetical protein L211DRAFT_833703 [Terfezia boudieri ATCC MYA-4762]|uniref:t-SNARE coiled-coil homology domain-containing protein n=1 Tax=Terfezia boudieri ATCC MYA-4762 TaxID=1051890 RepID=A0A3N4MK58_9PEZI|nr:hypothetical protein L211DRAFT_833703 [Terfezia boudieri ATCC MYA-4762]